MIEEYGGIKLFDFVRSYDFDGCEDAYIEGMVVGFAELDGCKRYVIHTYEKHNPGGVVFDVKHLGEHAYPPVNGTPRSFSGRLTSGVVKVSESGIHPR